MPLSTKKSRLTIDGERCGDIIDWTPINHPSPEETDTSVIDRAEDAYAPRIEIEDVNPPEITINLYDDPTNLGQQKLVFGATGLDFVGYPTGPEVGKQMWTYSNCTVTGDDPGTIAYKGFFKRTIKIKAIGGLAKTVVA